MSNFVVLRRTQSEIDVFGGDVYIDIDGKNVGIIKKQNLQFDLSIGKHTIKMYKSHTMGTFIGICETEIDIIEGEKLYARYSAPLMVNQPGNIVIAPFVSESELDSIADDIEKSIHSDYSEQQNKIEETKKEIEKSNSTLYIWIVVSAIIFLLCWLSTMSYFW